MADRKTYVVKSSGWLLGDWKNAGTHVELNESQARPFIAEGRLELKVDPDPKVK